MTRFNHAKRSGRHKRPKRRARGPLGIGHDVDRLLVHRQLAALRNPSPERFAKLAEAERRLRAS